MIHPLDFLVEGSLGAIIGTIIVSQSPGSTSNKVYVSHETECKLEGDKHQETMLF